MAKKPVKDDSEMMNDNGIDSNPSSADGDNMETTSEGVTISVIASNGDTSSGRVTSKAKLSDLVDKVIVVLSRERLSDKSTLTLGKQLRNLDKEYNREYARVITSNDDESISFADIHRQVARNLTPEETIPLPF